MPSARAEAADFAIVGGGPAGAAAALTLRRHSPDAAIILLERGDYSQDKAGEILPACARQLLERLGVMPAFEAENFVSSRFIASRWASDSLDERHSLFSAQGAGWHLDRRRFDRLLAQAAAEAGAMLRTGTAIRSAAPLTEGWRLALAGGGRIDARCVVWATGRSWRLARSFGSGLETADRLAACIAFVPDRTSDHRMLIEARPEGWWYSAGLPGGRRVVACLTDADLIAPLGLRTASGWQAALASTLHVSKLVGDDAARMPDRIVSAGSARLKAASGRRWVAAGDTLLAADPLSSRGLVHALRSGTLAAYAAADIADGRGELAGRRYAMFAEAGFDAYARSLVDHYAKVEHWPEALFWRRRQPSGGARAERRA